MNNNVKNTYRWRVLALAVVAMLFAGIIYAWSILKVPFVEDFKWGAQALSLNFTLTMCTFCLGGLLGSFLSRKIGVKASCILAAMLAGGGMIFTGFLNGVSVIMLYFTYAAMAGLGIGIAYNVIISTVSAWFPDKKGLSTGCLMMGFGASSLLLGNLADALFKTKLDRKGTYIILGVSLFLVLFVIGLVLKRPDGVDLPEPKKAAKIYDEAFERLDFTTKQMLTRFSFWRAFLMLMFATAVGNSVISFARDLALSVGTKPVLATSLVGVLAVCNGLGRILTGATFDVLGRKKTMIIATVLTIIAAAVTLVSVVSESVVICIIGLCLTGLSYGSCPTMVTAFTSAFYGQKHFATNFSVMNCNLLFASFIATACSSLLKIYGGYTIPFVLLLVLSAIAFLLNLSIKKP